LRGRTLCACTFLVIGVGAAQLSLFVRGELGEAMALYVLQIAPNQARPSPPKPNHAPTFTSHIYCSMHDSRHHDLLNGHLG
jgi:hypothetical protein